MPARRSELWRRLETVNSALAEARRLHNRAQTLAGMWREVANNSDEVWRLSVDGKQATDRAEHWRKQAGDYLADIRRLIELRSELALTIAVKQAPHARTRGNASERMEKG